MIPPLSSGQRLGGEELDVRLRVYDPLTHAGYIVVREGIPWQLLGGVLVSVKGVDATRGDDSEEALRDFHYLVAFRQA